MRTKNGYGIRARRDHRALLGALLLMAGIMLVQQACTQQACAQQSSPPRISLGVLGAYEVGTTSGGIATWVGRPDCGTYGNGTLRALRLGGRCDLSGLALEDLGISLRADWSSSNEKFTTSQLPLKLYSPATDSLITAGHDFQLALTRQRVALGALVSWHLLGPITIGVGPRFGFLIGSSASNQEHLDASQGVMFEDGSSTRTVPDPPPTDPSSVTIDACAGLWGTVPFGNRLRFAFELGGNYGLRSESIAWDQRTRSLSASFGILFDATPAGVAAPSAIATAELPSPEPLPERISEVLQAPLVTLDPPRRTRISASLSLYGIDDDGRHQDLAQVLVNEQVERTFSRIPAAVPFRQGTAILEDDCVGSAEKSTNGNESSVSTQARACRILDMVGERLRAKGNALLTIAPGHSDAGLFQARCQAVRLRLMDKWGVAADRVLCASSMRAERGDTMHRPGEEEVLLSSNDPDILAAVRSESVNRTFGAPRLKLEPYYQTDAGVARWEIILSYRGMPIVRYESTGGAEQHETDYEWHPDVDELAADTSALVATFTVQDSANEVATAYDRIRLSVDRRRSVMIRKIDERMGTEQLLYIIPDDPEEERRIMDTIAAAVRSDDHVSVLAVRPASGSTREQTAGLLEKSDRLVRTVRERLGAGQRREIPRRALDARDAPGELPAGSVTIAIDRTARH